MKTCFPTLHSKSMTVPPPRMDSPATRFQTLTLASTSPLFTRIYSERRGSGRFAVAFGYCFGLDRVHLINKSSEFDGRGLLAMGVPNWLMCLCGMILVAVSEFAMSILNQLSRIMQISHAVWEKSKIGVLNRMEIFCMSSYFLNVVSINVIV